MEKIILTTIEELKDVLRIVFAEERQTLFNIKTKEAENANPELLTNDEACSLLRIKSRSTLYRFIKEEGLPFKKIGRSTLLVKQDLIKFITNKRTRS